MGAGLFFLDPISAGKAPFAGLCYEQELRTAKQEFHCITSALGETHCFRT
jgi:hypothetical protein